MWWLLTQQFGLRGRQEHRRMRLEDFRIMKGVDDLEFVEFAEGPTKTRPGCLNAKSRQFQPRMFQTGRERCPVALFRQYISQRPPNLRTNGPFISQQNTADDLVIKFGTKSSPWKKIKSTQNHSWAIWEAVFQSQCPQNACWQDEESKSREVVDCRPLVTEISSL